MNHKERIMIDYFPSKLAIGEQFCNRVAEKALLKANIEKVRHTVLIAPRRYGKSSLVTNVIKAINCPVASIDLFLAHDDLAVTKRLLSGIGQIISQLLPLNQKILSKLQGLFGKFRVTLGAHGFNLDMAQTASGYDVVDQIFSSMESLAQLTAEHKRTVVIFLDEFQDIREAESAKAIQGAIRHVAQASEWITFIFSGSNRRLLLELFDDATKPLYMLCERLTLTRIACADYETHLQLLADKKWHTVLEPILFDRIMFLTEAHPYYVNLLCHELWKNVTMPTLDQVTEAWEYCYECHYDRLIAELEKLTAKQQDFLKTLAFYPTTEPTGHTFIRASNLSVSGINQTVKALQDKDMVYRIKKIDNHFSHMQVNQLRVLDPLLAHALRKYG